MARGSSGIKMPTEFEEALNQSFFKRLFVSERKQIAMIADEKSPARISHRIFATRSLRNVGNGMNEKSLEVLKQYDFEVNRVLRGRGGMILNTDRGVKLFLECVKSDKYYERENDITRRVADSGFLWVDTYVQNSSGEILTPDEDGRRFYVKDWYEGKECNVRDLKDLCRAVQTLAQLHLVLLEIAGELSGTSEEQNEKDVKAQSPADIEAGGETQLRLMYTRHMKELKLTGNYLKNKKKKSEFEQLAYKNIGSFFSEAEKAVQLLAGPQFQERLSYAKKTGELCHGSYNYHNIIFSNGNTAVTNFDKYKNECQISDLYQFMRKILEKYDWDIQTAYKMMEEYDKIKPVSDTERALLAALFAFPEKFWKVMNYYFNSNKAWIPPKTKEKLEKVVQQNEKRQKFLETLL